MVGFLRIETAPISKAVEVAKAVTQLVTVPRGARRPQEVAADIRSDLLDCIDVITGNNFVPCCWVVDEKIYLPPTDIIAERMIIMVREHNAYSISIGSSTMITNTYSTPCTHCFDAFQYHRKVETRRLRESLPQSTVVGIRQHEIVCTSSVLA